MNGFLEDPDINKRLYILDNEDELDRVDFSLPPSMDRERMGENLNYKINQNGMMPEEYEMDSGDETPLWKMTCLSKLSPQDIERLKGSIEGEIEGYMYYIELAKRFNKSPQKNRILKIASDELMHSRRFKSAYFIATGKMYNPVVPKPVIPPTVAAIRDRYEDERKDAAKYLKYADETDDECLKELYIDTARYEKRHAAYFYRLLSAILD